MWKTFLLPRLEIKLKLRGLGFSLLEVLMVSELGWCKHPISPWGGCERSPAEGVPVTIPISLSPQLGFRQEERKRDIAV